jgi:hypothetical protein
MKGLRLNVTILTFLALVLGVLMAVLNTYPSWSQHAGTNEDPLLYATLFCIASAFMIASFGHPDKKREITKMWVIGSYRLEHCFRLVAYFFGGVIAFSVNSEIKIIETFHLAFTALAIAAGYLGLILYPETKKGHLWSWIGFAFGVGGFLLGFIFGLWSIAWAEVLAAFPLATWMFITYKKKKDVLY